MLVTALAMLLFSTQAADPAENEAADPLATSLECKAYSKLAMELHKDEPRFLTMDLRIAAYWATEARRIAAERKLSDEALEIQELIIPIEAERFKPVMLACIKAMPKDAWKK